MAHTIVLRPFDHYAPSLFTALTKLATTPINLVSPVNIAFARGEVALAPTTDTLNIPSNSEALDPSPPQGSKGDEKGPELPNEALEDIRRVPKDPDIVLKMIRDDPLVADIVAIRMGFKLRVEATDTYVSLLNRPTFQQMFWTTLVFSRNSSREVQLTNGITTDSATPLILPVTIDSIESVVTEGAYLKTVDMIEFVMHTEGLLQLYPPPASLLSRLWEVAVKVKDNLFARYMGTRSPWRLNNRIGHWVLVLIEWWVATHPQSLKEYQSSIFTFKRPMPGREIVRSGHKRGYTGRLKKELRAAMGAQLDDSEERTLLNEGFEFISMMRREMTLAVQEEYEALVQEARVRDKFWTREVDASYLGRERFKLFRAMMGQEEPGPSQESDEQSLSKGEMTRSKSPRKNLNRVQALEVFSR